MFPNQTRNSCFRFTEAKSCKLNKQKLIEKVHYLNVDFLINYP